jgi:hypothetical protein
MRGIRHGWLECLVRNACLASDDLVGSLTTADMHKITTHRSAYESLAGGSIAVPALAGPAAPRGSRAAAAQPPGRPHEAACPAEQHAGADRHIQWSNTETGAATAVRGRLRARSRRTAVLARTSASAIMTIAATQALELVI